MRFRSVRFPKLIRFCRSFINDGESGTALAHSLQGYREIENLLRGPVYVPYKGISTILHNFFLRKSDGWELNPRQESHSLLFYH